MNIQHNVSALNTHHNLNFNNANANKALEKLSSGFKINRTGDDVASLVISEKMHRTAFRLFRRQRVLPMR